MLARRSPERDRGPRLAIVSSHPIQYNAPLFRKLASLSNMSIKVFYSWEGPVSSADPEFGHPVTWDLPLLEGYEWEMLANRARDPGTHRFSGLDNPDMVRIIEAWGPDAVLVYGWSSKTHLRVMRHFKGRRPVLFRGDSTLLSATGGARRLLRIPALRWVYGHVDLALYPGQRNRDYLLRCGVPADRMMWMPHAVDNSRFATDHQTREADAAAIRARLGVKPSETTFLFAGKLVDRKQPELLIQAFNAARWDTRGPPHLIFAGAGPLEEGLRALSRGSDRIHFIGFQNQTSMPVAYRLGDVYVLPSSRETWGLGVNEAMACARPVLVSDRVGCAPDLAADKPFARIFEADKSLSLSAAMIELDGLKPYLPDMGRSAARFISDWSIDSAAGTIVAATLHVTRMDDPRSKTRRGEA